MMSSGCTSSMACIDARSPVRANYVNLYKWPESDAEFVRSVTGRKRTTSPDVRSDRSGCSLASPTVIDSHACRQLFLKSYTFSREESIQEKTRRCIGKVPFISHKTESCAGANTTTTTTTTTTTSSQRSISEKKRRKKTNKKKKKKKSCGTARKLKEVSYSMLHSIFSRLLFCTTSVDVVD